MIPTTDIQKLNKQFYKMFRFDYFSLVDNWLSILFWDGVSVFKNRWLGYS